MVAITKCLACGGEKSRRRALIVDVEETRFRVDHCWRCNNSGIELKEMGLKAFPLLDAISDIYLERN
jgi:hypothetical protein